MTFMYVSVANIELNIN